MTSAQFPASRSRSRSARNKTAYSRLSRAAIALAVCAALDPAYAQVGANTLPTGPRVNTGAATVGTTGSKMTVTQTTPKVSLGWESFSIGSKASVTFVQPSSSSVALNRVLGSDPSWIYGSLSSNGKVFLINQAGVLFAPGARVNVGGIAASTLDMSDADFMAGRYVFSGTSTASVVNRGSIITSPGGYAALIGADVANEGTISAPGGSVALAAGSRVTMDLAGDGLLSVSVDAASVRAMASNTGLIQADGGRVILSARAADALAGTVLNQTGIIEARSASMRNGEIVLDGGSNGIVAVAGKLDVSGTQAGATGGKVTVTGNLVGLYGADINASGDAGGGTILVGGDYQGKNPDVQNAFRTYVDSGSRLNADAITTGNGGKVIVWADDVTRYYGTITARGGAQGGDGGFAEVSGKQSLIYAGTADLTAAKGKVGTLLLDPANIEIEAAGTDAVATNDQFAENSGNTSTISPADLESALNLANVTLQASNDISVLSSVDASGGGAFNLALEAGRSILIGASVTLNGSFTATANTTNAGVVLVDRGAGGGSFTMTDGVTIDTATANANIDIRVQTGAGGGFASGSITLSNLSAGTGHVSINQGGATPASHILRTTNSVIDAASVALQISNALNTTGTIGASGTDGAIRVNATNLEAKSQNGAIFLEAVGGVDVGSSFFGGGIAGISAGTGNVTLTSDGAITQSEAVSGNTLTVKTLNDTAAAATITLNNPANEFVSVDLRARNAADNANSNNDISYRDATAFDVAAAHSLGNVTLTGGGAITDGASGTLTGSILTVKTLNNAGAAITLDNAGHQFATVDLRARDAADANNAAGAITYVNAVGFSAAARSASTVSFTATTGDLSVDPNDIVTNSGAVTLTALEANKSINSLAGSNIDTSVGGGAAVTLQADNNSLFGSINAGLTGLVTLRPNANAVAIQVGSTAAEGTAGVLGITEAELDTITTAGGVTIGSTTNTLGITVVGTADQTGGTITGGTFSLLSGSGNIVVNGALSNAVNTTLQTTSGNIIFGGGSITASGFTVNLTATGGEIQGNAGLGTNDVTALTLNALASTGIGAGALANALETAVTNLSFTNTTGAVQITNTLAGGVTVSGTNAGTGAVNITETAGNLTVGGFDIVTNSGVVTLTNSAVTGAIISAASSDISTIGGATAGADVNLIANNMNLAGATNSGTATTTLRQFTNGVLIDVGGADVAGTTLGITPAELNTITAGKIKIGDVNSGAMTITGATAIQPTGTNLLSLESGTTITQTTNTAPIVVTNLALRAGTGIDLTANGSVIAGEGNTVTNLAAVTSAAGNISFRNNATMTVGVVDGVDGISTFSGDISVTVAGNSAGATNLFIDKVAAGGGGTVTLVASNPLAGQANIFEAPLGGGTGDSPDFDITTTGALSMNAKNDIGQPSGTGAGPIEISVGSAAWANGPGGASYLLQTGDLVLTGMTTDGDVNIEVIGTITTSGDLNVNGNTKLTSIGDGEDIIISNGIVRTNNSAGFITLQAQRHVILDANGYILAKNFDLSGDGKTIVTLNSDSNALNGGAILIEKNLSFASITSNNGPVILGGGLNPLTAAAIGTDFNGSTLFNGIDLQGAIVSGTGNVNLLGQSFYGGGQSGVSGVTVNSGGSITSTTGNITIKGIGDRGTGTTQGVLVADSGTTLTTTSGTMFVEGLHVNDVSGGNNVGVLVRDSAVISSTSAGAAGLVTLKGTGGAGLLDADHGVVVTGGASVTVSGANLNLEGTGGGGGASGGANSVGVQIAGGAIVETIGTGKVTLTGTGGATDGGFNYGIEITDLNTQLRATSTGATTLRIDLLGVGGAGGATGTDNYGILVGSDALVTTKTGNIAFTGTGGASDGGNNFGIAVLGGGIVESTLTIAGAGSIAFTGVGGAGGGGRDSGIVISDTNSRVSTTFANISFTGTGGSGDGIENFGIHISNAAEVVTAGAGQILLDGTGSATSNGGSNFGVWIDVNGKVLSTGITQTGTEGKIKVIGHGGLGTGATDGGIGLASGGTVSTVDAEIEFQGTGGAGTVGGQSYGVYSNGGIISTSGDGNILITGTGGAAAGGSNHGIFTEGTAQITSSAANAINPAGTITLAGTAGVGGNDNIGINITDGTTVTSLDGKIDFFGTGTGIGTGSHGVRLATDASITSNGLAVIEIDGFGATQGTGGGIGILLDTGAAITSAGTSTITLTGTGGGASGSGNDNYGIQVNGTSLADTKITSVTGNILLTGTGGGQTTSTGNAGIKVSGEADISTTGAAKVDLVGLSGITTGTNNYGVWITGTDTTVESTPTATATGDLNITGTGRGTGTFAVGVVVDSNALVTTTGAGDVTIIGTGSTTGSGTAYGIQVDSGAGISSNTGAGKITLTGTGGGTSGSGTDNWGIRVNGTGTLDTRITSVTGDVLLTGTGGGQTTSNSNFGVGILGEADIASTGAAKIDIIGLSGITSGSSNYGVLIRGADTTVSSSGTATSDITISGTGRGTGGFAEGVQVDLDARVTTTGAGDIAITGIGSTTGTGNAWGILVDTGAGITSDTGVGKITLTGTGGSTAGSGNDNYGVWINGTNLADTRVTSVTGNILISGTGGGTGAATGNIGVLVSGAADIATTGAAKVDIIGLSGITSGTNNVGVRIQGAGTTVETSGTATSDITITGTGRGSDPAPASHGVVIETGALVTATGAGDITVTGLGSTATSFGNAVGIQVNGASVTATATGMITLDGTGGGTLGASDNVGVKILGASLIKTTGDAKIDIIGQGGNTSGINNYGVQITGPGTSVENNGTATSLVTIDGTGGGTGTAAHGVVIDTGALVTATSAGNIAVTGLGSTTGSGNAVGIQVDGAQVSATATGTITLTGTGGGTGTATDNVGVKLLGAAFVLTSGDATIDIIGQGGNTTGVNNYGVQITGVATRVETSGTATSIVTIDGTGGGTGTSANGVVIDTSALVRASGAGNVVILGDGSTTGSGNAVGIQVNGATVDSTGTGTITLTGTGGGTTGSGHQNYGVHLLNAAQVGSTTGDILVNGTGGGNPAWVGPSEQNIGVLVAGGSDIVTTGDAKIDIIGQSGITGGLFNFGVQVTGTGSTVSSSGTATSDITINGTGRGTGLVAFGVFVDTNAQILTTGLGDIAVTGLGSTTGTAAAAGIVVADAASIVSNTSTGKITLTGTGGGTAGAGDQNYGVAFVNAAQVSSVTGDILIGGTGGGTGGSIDNVGVLVSGGTGGSVISTTGAATTTINGTGGNTGGTGNHGVQVTNSGTMVTSVSSAIFLNGNGGGTGGDSVGVLVSDTALVGTATGSVTLTGIGAAAGANNFGVSMVGGTVESTSTGSLALIGTGGAGAKGISTTGGGNTIGSGSMTNTAAGEGEILLRSLAGTGMVSDATILNDGSGIVTLNAVGGGGFNQTGGSVVSGGLRFLGSGTFDLPDPIAANAVTNIAGTLADTSAVTFVQAGSVNVASLTSFQDGVGINQTTSNGFDIAGLASSLSITSGGITQTAPIVVPGTTTLTEGTNNIVLNDPGNFFGTINVVSANNATLGGTSIGLGDVTLDNNLTINAGTLTDSGTVIVPGLATFNVTGDMLLDSPNSDFNRVTFNVGGNAALTDVNDLVVNTSTIGGNLTLTTGGSLNTTPFNIVTVGGNVFLNVGTGGLGTLNNDFHLNTDGAINVAITGFVPPFSTVSGFVVNDGAGLLFVAVPPTAGIVRFNQVEFVPPTPLTAAFYSSQQYAFVTLDEITDLIYVSDDTSEQEYPGVRGRIGRVANGANIHRDGGIRMPPGLVTTGGGLPTPDAGFEPLQGSRFLFRN